MTLFLNHHLCRYWRIWILFISFSMLVLRIILHFKCFSGQFSCSSATKALWATRQVFEGRIHSFQSFFTTWGGQIILFYFTWAVEIEVFFLFPRNFCCFVQYHDQRSAPLRVAEMNKDSCSNSFKLVRVVSSLIEARSLPYLWSLHV